MTSDDPQPPAGEGQEPLTPRAQVALVAGPLGGFVLILGVTWAIVGPGAAGFLASMAAATFVGGGKLVILAGAVEQAPVGHWALAALVVYIDVSTALVVLGGMQQLYRLPGAGPRLAAARESGWRLLQRHPWTYHATWVSLAGFVAVPFHGTGALVGALVGRLLGLSRVSIGSATLFGSASAAIALGFAGEYWAERINAVAGHPVLAVAAVVTTAALAILASKWMFGEGSDEHTSASKGG
ncbi:MAG: small multi-drug export protein [Gemmatimonadota bacterium]|nr:small multi-drug export protein [Gemmatimonadota bacterium]MDH3423498.1 small multi-drug export protein [Gemmatimonadota bacterium]